MKKLLLFAFAFMAIFAMSCTDPMEETLNSGGGIDGDPITIKQTP